MVLSMLKPNFPIYNIYGGYDLIRDKQCNTIDRTYVYAYLDFYDSSIYKMFENITLNIALC